MNPAETFWALATLIIRETRRFLRIWTQTLVPPMVTVSLYFAIFGTLIGPRIGEMGGFGYVQFMVPGLVMMAIINNTYANVSSSLFGSKFQRNIEDMLTSPMPLWVLLLGFSLGGVVRGLLVGVLVMSVSMFFSPLPINNPLLVTAVMVLSSMLFALGGFINGLLANSFDDISVIPNFILTPLIYLGGVFYSVEILPEFWRNLSFLNPVLYLVNAFRYAMLGASDMPIDYALTIIFVMIVLLATLCLWMMHRGIGIRS